MSDCVIHEHRWAHKSRLLSVAFAMIVLGHAGDFWFYTDHWPFARYSMYNFTSKSRFSFYVLYGVRLDGSEFSLGKRDYVYPFYRRPLNVIFENILGRPQSNQIHNIAYNIDYKQRDRSEQTRRALQDLLQRYEQRRRAGKHHGPLAHKLRLYRMTWDIDPTLRNKEQGSEKEWVAEFEMKP